MALSEFELIKRYFAARGPIRSDVVLGVGDDGALLEVPAGNELVVTVDTLVAGVHFPVATAPDAIGYKALAVSLSDLAAMAATPAWATLALTLPEPDEAWLDAFCDGLFRLATKYDVQLVGGDTTRGPLSVTIQAHGLVPRGVATRRRGSRAGDLIYVTGTFGDAGLGLRCLDAGEAIAVNSEEQSRLVAKLNYPEPRINEGLMLRGLATAAIDVSDGLVADLNHILESSNVGASIELGKVPVSPAVSAYVNRMNIPAFPLTAGDDYELCFTLPAAQKPVVEKQFAASESGCHCIGRIEEQPGLRCIGYHGELLQLGYGGYRHFYQSVKGINRHG